MPLFQTHFLTSLMARLSPQPLLFQSVWQQLSDVYWATGWLYITIFCYQYLSNQKQWVWTLQNSAADFILAPGVFWSYWFPLRLFYSPAIYFSHFSPTQACTGYNFTWVVFLFVLLNSTFSYFTHKFYILPHSYCLLAVWAALLEGWLLYVCPPLCIDHLNRYFSLDQWRSPDHFGNPLTFQLLPQRGWPLVAVTLVMLTCFILHHH